MPTQSPDYYVGKALGEIDRKAGRGRMSDEEIRAEFEECCSAGGLRDMMRGYADAYGATPESDHLDRLIQAMEDWEEFGYVTDDAGNAIDIDGPTSPIRLAGMI